MGFKPSPITPKVSALPVNRNLWDKVNRLIFCPHSTAGLSLTNAALDTTTLYQGGATIKATSADGAWAFIGGPVISGPLDFSATDYIDLIIKVDNLTNLKTVNLYLSSTVDFNNYYVATVAATFLKYVALNGWRYLRFPKYYFSSTYGSPDWSTIRAVRISVQSNAGTTVNVNVGAFRQVSVEKAVIGLDFDDGTSDQYTLAFPTLEKYGLVGHMSPITAKVGTTGYITWEQLRALEAAGWSIGSHAHNHVDLSTADDATRIYECAASKAALKDHGLYLASSILVAPFGGWSSAVDAIAKQYFKVCRTTVTTGTDVDEFPPSHERYHRYTSVFNTNTAADVQGWIDNAISRKGYKVITFHTIVDGAAGTTYQWPVADLDAVCAYLRTKIDAGLLVVLNKYDIWYQTKSVKPIDINGHLYQTSAVGHPVVLDLTI